MMPIDVCSLARGVADDLRSTLEQHKHMFTVLVPAEPITISADLGYLRMAIENLLHNACLYTPDGGKISLAVSVDSGRICIKITDNGVGIRKADLSKLFTKFSRIHNPLSVQAGGSGIGLYLTAEIVRLHGGVVTVDSQFKRGTTFAIFLPVAQNKNEAKRNKRVSAKSQDIT
jgi:signal transduction histidine kinase